MENIIIKRDGDILTLEIDLSRELGPSKRSGKTVLVANSGGNIPIPGLEEYGFRLGLFMYFYPGAAKPYVSEVPEALKKKRVSREPLNVHEKKSIAFKQKLKNGK